MAENKKSIVEEALLDLKTIQETLSTNTKEILRSTAREEIDGVLKESINEDMYDETDVDDTEEVDVDVAADDEGDADIDVSTDNDVPAEPAAPVADELGGDDSIELGAQGGVDYGAEEGGLEDFETDLTGASDADVIAVYKKLAGEDEIEIVSPNEVIIKDPASGAEYNVKMGGNSGAPAATGGLDLGIDSEIEPEGGLDLGIDAGDETEVELEPAADTTPAEAPATDAPSTPEDGGLDLGAEEDNDDDDELGENVVFEIALGDGADIAEDIIRTKGHDTHLTTTTMDSGDIEGTKADKDPDSGDNLTGGFDDDAVSHANAEGPMVMGENEDLEEVDEQITQNRVAANRAGGINKGEPEIGQPVGAGAKDLAEANKRYNALLTEARKIKRENEDLTKSLVEFRQTLGKIGLFNTNLVNCTRLFTEHSTTPDEKQKILHRFDEVNTLVESKQLYARIKNELTSKTPLIESIETKIAKGVTSGTSGQLNESTAYVDQSTKRIINLINRVENR